MDASMILRARRQQGWHSLVLRVVGVAAIAACSKATQDTVPGLAIGRSAAGSSPGAANSGVLSGGVPGGGGTTSAGTGIGGDNLGVGGSSGGVGGVGVGGDDRGNAGPSMGGGAPGPSAAGGGGAFGSGTAGAGAVSANTGNGGAAAGASPSEGGAGAGSTTAAAAPLVITSEALKEGVSVAAKYRCDGPSPALSWSGGPAEAQSYAIVFIDTTPGFSHGFAHWIIYDIPANVHALREAIPRGPTVSDPVGAKQVKIRDAAVSGLRQPPGAPTVVGYRGPCGPGGVFTYDFTLYALRAPTVPNVTETSLPDEVTAAIEAQALASTTLKLTSME